MKKLLLAAAVLAASASGAQATTLTYEGTHQAPNAIDYYWFHADGGDVTIVMDTLSDGFDATLTIWQKVEGSYVAGQPDDSDWAFVNYSVGADTYAYLDEGTQSFKNLDIGYNVFGVALKDGWIGSASLFPTGNSDPGAVFSGLSGDYLITVNGSLNDPIAFLPGDLMSAGWLGFEEYAPFNTYPHDYKFTIDGNVSEVSQVPLPAAVWLFGTALAGLGTLSRKRALAA